MSAIGQVVGGRYRIERRLGEGGFGTVYGATDEQLKRTVAVKLLDPAQGSSGATGDPALLRERFRQEAVVTAAITHPNVVTIYDVGVNAADGEVYIVMELLEGHSLKEELAYHPDGMEPTRILPHFVEVLEGLGVGHQAGVVHKDLKPANLFLTQPGTRREMMSVIDFGIARVLHEQKLTATGRLVGTPRYLAPEYILEHRVSPALDVYQIGLLLVESLTGVACIPRGIPVVECCERHIRGTLRIPSQLREGPLGPVLQRALALDPNDRYASGLQFSEALAAVRASEVAANLPDVEGATVPTRAVPASSAAIDASPPSAAAAPKPAATLSMDAFADSQNTMTTSVAAKRNGDAGNGRRLLIVASLLILFSVATAAVVVFLGNDVENESSSASGTGSEGAPNRVEKAPTPAPDRAAETAAAALEESTLEAADTASAAEPKPEVAAAEANSKPNSAEEPRTANDSVAAEPPREEAREAEQATEAAPEPQPRSRPRPAVKPRPAEPEEGLRIID